MKALYVTWFIHSASIVVSSGCPQYLANTGAILSLSACPYHAPIHTSKIVNNSTISPCQGLSVFYLPLVIGVLLARRSLGTGPRLILSCTLELGELCGWRSMI
jgi:hypothetical protein